MSSARGRWPGQHSQWVGPAAPCRVQCTCTVYKILNEILIAMLEAMVAYTLCIYIQHVHVCTREECRVKATSVGLAHACPIIEIMSDNIIVKVTQNVGNSRQAHMYVHATCYTYFNAKGGIQRVNQRVNQTDTL